MSIHLLKRASFMGKPGAGPAPGDYFEDDFVGAFGDDIVNRPGWSIISPGANRITIADTLTHAEVRLNQTNSHSIYRTDTTNEFDNVRMTLRGVNPAGSASAYSWRAFIRYEDEQNYIYITFNSGSSYDIWSLRNGGFRQITSISLVAGDDISIGSNVRTLLSVWKNDVIVDNFTLNTDDSAGNINGLMARRQDAYVHICDKLEVGPYYE